jgi:hypothetical protein
MEIGKFSVDVSSSFIELKISLRFRGIEAKRMLKVRTVESYGTIAIMTEGTYGNTKWYFCTFVLQNFLPGKNNY